MEPVAIFEKQRYIFGGLFILSNKLQVIGDRILEEFTTKQWLLTVVIANCGDTPPTLREVSEAMGSSHQNVKQLALKLQEKGFLQIEKDERDSRALRLKLTEKCNSYWKRRQTEDEQFIKNLFNDLNADELNSMYEGINRLHQKVMKIIDQGNLFNQGEGGSISNKNNSNSI
ncbi:MAG TPA: MarR family transcriptional regulator [Bacillota bacterium]|nr:MarR family transcriptional regulator [Bacillota bacterium]